MDSLLCLWVTASLASAHAALTSGRLLRQRWWIMSAAACGLALLTKGPVALVLILTPLILYMFLEPPVPGRPGATGALRSRGWIRGRAVVRRRDGASAGLRLHVFLAPSRRALPDAVRSRETGVVLPTRTACRHVAVDAALARFPSFPGPSFPESGAAAPRSAGFFPLVVSSLSFVLFGIGLQAASLHFAGAAAAGPGAGLLFASACAVRPSFLPCSGTD